MSPDLPAEDEHRYPLTVVFCPQCSLVQIKETVPPTVLFDEDYPYFSSFSDELLEHSRTHAEGLVEELGLGGDNLVVELASNDGYLLQWFLEGGGARSRDRPGTRAGGHCRGEGHPHDPGLLHARVGTSVFADGVRADVVLGNNVLAHVPDQNRFVAGIATILSPEGRVEIEVPYVRDMVDNCEFDTIYHEHHCIFSVTALATLFARHGLDLIRVRHLPIHGGSLRVTFSASAEAEPSVKEYLEEEQTDRAHGAEYYAAFSDQVEEVREGLIGLLSGLDLERGEDRRIRRRGQRRHPPQLHRGGEVSRLRGRRNVHKHGLAHARRAAPHLPARTAARRPARLSADTGVELRGRDHAPAGGVCAARGGRFIVPVPQPTVL